MARTSQLHARADRCSWPRSPSEVSAEYVQLCVEQSIVVDVDLLAVAWSLLLDRQCEMIDAGDISGASALKCLITQAEILVSNAQPRKAHGARLLS